MRFCCSVIVLLFVCPLAHADPFRYEARGGFARDDGDFFETDTLSVDVRYYFDIIDDGDGPLAEAAFLRPASNLAAAYRDADRALQVPMAIFTGPALTAPSIAPAYHLVPPPAFVGVSVPAAPGSITDTGSASARFEFVSPSRWIASVEVERTDGDAQQLFSATDIEDTAYALDIGRYVANATTVSLGFGYLEAEQTFTAPRADCSLISCVFEPGPVLVSTSRQRAWRLRGRHLQQAGSMHYAIEAEAHYSVSTLNTDAGDDLLAAPPVVLLVPQQRFHALAVSVSGTLYPRRNLGLGLSVGYDDLENGSVTNVALQAQWFLTSSVALSGRVGRVVSDRLGALEGDSDTVAIGILGRF